MEHNKKNSHEWNITCKPKKKIITNISHTWNTTCMTKKILTKNSHAWNTTYKPKKFSQTHGTQHFINLMAIKNNLINAIQITKYYLK